MSRVHQGLCARWRRPEVDRGSGERGSESIQLTGITHKTNDIAKVPSVDLGRMPVGPVLAASRSRGRGQVNSQWPSFTDAMNEFNLDIGDRNLAAIDKLEGPEGIKDLDFTVVLHQESAGAVLLAKKVAAKMSEFNGVELAVVKTNGGAVLSTNEAFGNGFTNARLNETASR